MIPSVKREIESVSEIVLPRPRIKGQVALYYPLETFRAYIPDTMARRARAPLNRDLVRLYGALLASGYPVGVVFSKDVTANQSGRYKALFIKNACCSRLTTWRRSARCGFRQV